MDRSPKEICDVACPSAWDRMVKMGCALRQVGDSWYHSDRRRNRYKDVDEAGNPTMVHLAFEGEIPTHGILLRVVLTMKKRVNSWLPTGNFWVFHCGPNGDGDANHEVFFRIDNDAENKEHFHLRGEPNAQGSRHIPLGESIPPLAGMTLSRFLDLVDQFIASKKTKMPVMRKL